MHIVSASFFEMMSARVVRGRWLADSDVPGAQPVAVVNETMSKRYFRDSNPIGRSIVPRMRYTNDLVSYLIGVSLRLEPLPILGVCAIVAVGSALFATLSMLVATVVRSRERFSTSRSRYSCAMR